MSKSLLIHGYFPFALVKFWRRLHQEAPLAPASPASNQRDRALEGRKTTTTATCHGCMYASTSQPLRLNSPLHPHLVSHSPFCHHRSWSCCATNRALSAPTSTSATRDATSTTAAPAPGWCAPSSWCTARRWTAWGKTAPPLATSGRAPKRIKRWVASC